MPFKKLCIDTIMYLESGCQISGKDIIDTVKSILEDTQESAFRLQIWDYSQTFNFALRTEEMRTLHNMSMSFDPKGKKYFMALVAPNQSVSFRLQALLDYIGVNHFASTKLFKNIDDAQHWLSLQSAQVT